MEPDDKPARPRPPREWIYRFILILMLVDVALGLALVVIGAAVLQAPAITVAGGGLALAGGGLFLFFLFLGRHEASRRQSAAERLARWR